jgi:hypothetical protein
MPCEAENCHEIVILLPREVCYNPCGFLRINHGDFILENKFINRALVEIPPYLYNPQNSEITAQKTMVSIKGSGWTLRELFNTNGMNEQKRKILRKKARVNFLRWLAAWLKGDYRQAANLEDANRRILQEDERLSSKKK